MAEIRKSLEPNNFHDLTYNFKGPNLAPINFIELRGPNHIFKSINNGDIALEDVEKEQIKLKSYLNDINQGPKYNKSPEQLNRIKNIKNIYESRKEVVKMFNNYAKNVSRNIYESTQGKELKILTPKQMLQRLPIDLAQIKAGNNSESLLNEIRQIVYSLHQSKKLPKAYITT